jgi:hypothetical protein
MWRVFPEVVIPKCEIGRNLKQAIRRASASCHVCGLIFLWIAPFVIISPLFDLFEFPQPNFIFKNFFQINIRLQIK